MLLLFCKCPFPIPSHYPFYGASNCLHIMNAPALVSVNHCPFYLPSAIQLFSSARFLCMKQPIDPVRIRSLITNTLRLFSHVSVGPLLGFWGLDVLYIKVGWRHLMSTGNPSVIYFESQNTMLYAPSFHIYWLSYCMIPPANYNIPNHFVNVQCRISGRNLLVIYHRQV